jgi:predicted dinucleotide-binding enzyme
MQIGIIGTGNMGRVLGALWTELGHDVVFGARTRASADAAVAVARAARAGTNQEAAAHGELVYFNPRDVPVVDILSDPRVLDGKIVIDSHNGPMPEPFALVPLERSCSELLQAQLPRARVVKAFNTIAQEVFAACPAPTEVATFIAGDDVAARAQVGELAHQMGLVPIDCGELRHARLLEVIGDFVRSLIGARADLFTTLTIRSVPPAPLRFGGRAPTRLP